MRITHTGNVGIGTSSPAARLHVHASTWPNITLTTDDASVNSIELDSTNKTGGKKWRLVSSHGSAGEGQGNFFIQNGTDGINPFFIKANGNIGIGTSNPRQALEVIGSITTDWTNGERFIGMQYEAGAAYRMGMTFSALTRNLNLVAMSGDNTGNITFNTGSTPTERMRITPSGKVNIGITGDLLNTTNDKLVVCGDATGIWGSDSGQVRICGSSDSRKRLGLMVDTTNNVGIIQCGFSSISSLNLALNPPGGNVGIGTTAPSAKLHISGSAGGLGLELADTDQYANLRVMRNPSGDKTMWIGYGSVGGVLRLFSDNSETMILSGGAVRINAGASTTERFRIGDHFIVYEHSNQGRGATLLFNSGEYGAIRSAGGGIGICDNGGGNVGIGQAPGGSRLTVNGSVAKSGGTFDIEHPTEENKRLVHSFIEGPRVDLIYRGTVTLQNGTATVNLDTDAVEEPDCAMSPGTFEALCRNPVKYLHNNDSFNRVKGSISGNILTITCEDLTSSDTIDWMVIAERKDNFIRQWERTNDNGYLRTEYEIPVQETPLQETQ
jgi:hypothetical protein